MVKNVYLFNNFFKKKIEILNIYILLLVLIDIFCKNLIIKNIKLYKFYYICSYLNFIYLRNYGIIFGFFQNYQNIFLFLIKINITILVILIFIKDNFNQLIYNCLFSGILSNLINRIQYGFIIDFIDLHIYNYHFPVFNIADILICFGVIILIKDIFLNIK
ncbi:signal peptidase II [Enterobacteriaceae endosymbiont of Donacia thalassina]|uniref:signal peptidase II n=1 Tax=Enterobacteriaceae endosymbiont of Donacia thalassina TaxID=2675786 RepID=UPI001449407A|nr:signal peptidase II [Enterobacteriaceae endosymbiont of Donacia thalassina]QJC37189.1 signal peptidase II [Enterobacteriaceae endosymbiont of Donacia thalassina]